MFKIRILSVVIISIQFITSYAQDSIPDGPFIKFKDGSILAGKNIDVKKEYNNPGQINLDGKFYDAKDVAYYRNIRGVVFGNVGRFANSYYESKGFHFYILKKYHTSKDQTGQYRSSATEKYYFSYNLENMNKLSPELFLKSIPVGAPGYETLVKAKKAKLGFLISLGGCAAGWIIFGTGYTAHISNDPKGKKIADIGSLTVLCSVIPTYIFSKRKYKLLFKGLNEYCNHPIFK